MSQAATKKAPKAKKETPEPALPKIPDAVTTPRVVKEIPMDLIDLSPFETQARRRSHFTKEGIAELAEDIRINGLTHPVLVRPTKFKGKDRFELVVGERRFLAGEVNKAKVIDGTVEDLTDEQAFNKQQSENDERVDNHPLDEAFAYTEMADKFGYSDEEIAARKGKTLSYVLSRRKLLDLSEVVQTAFDEGRILLTHAQEIAKYRPEWHQAMLDACFTRDGGLITHGALVRLIQQNFLRRLDAAPFPKKSTELRPDGLACVVCPERTSVHQKLFADGYDSKDQCLNPTCWNEKVTNFVQIQRMTVALPDRDKSIGLTAADLDAMEAVPKLTDRYIYGANPEGFISLPYNNELKSKDACKHAETGVIIDGNRISQVAYFCRGGSCKVHGSRSSSNSANEPTAEEKSETRQKRKEELIDIRVGEVVRRRVLKAAAEKFAETFEISEALSEDLLSQLSAWMRVNGNHEHTDRVVYPVLDEWAGDAVTRQYFSHDHEELAKHFDELTRKRMVFMYLNASHGAMYYDSYASQFQIRKIADQYGVDYQLIDAEERLQHAMDKHKKWTEHFRQYHEAIKAGKRETAIPRVYYPDYATRT